MFSAVSTTSLQPSRRWLAAALFFAWIVIAVPAPSTAFALGGDGNDLLPDIPVGSQSIRMEPVTDVGAPMGEILWAPGDPDRMFLCTTNGFIRIYEGGALLPTPFLETPVAPLNRAMYGFAFHPDYATNGRLYVITGEALPNPSTPHYLPPQDLSLSAYDAIVFEYQVDATDPNRVDESTRRELLRIRQPQREHNINHLRFGEDGYLYLAVGDGGATRSGTPTPYQNNAMDLTNPYGSILRIDVDTLGTNGRYGIPSTNPRPAGAVPELFAWGLRNVWRITGDRMSDAIYLADNGDFTIERLYLLESGANYGWPTVEGSFLWDPVTGDATVDPSPDPTFVYPIAEYDHNTDQGAFGSIIGGPVYRGSEIPGLYGRLIAFDWVAGAFLSFDPITQVLEQVSQDPTGSIVGPNTGITFGESPSGELYLGTLGGEVWRLTGTPTTPSVFRRADCNGDQSTSLADVVCILGELFQSNPVACADASDTNDDGTLDVSDGVFLLSYLFLAGVTPPDPFGSCGDDPTVDTLDCAQHPCP